MIPQTAVALTIFLFLALSRKTTGGALGVIIVSMMLWPEYLRLPIGPAQMSVPRIVGACMLVKIMVMGFHHQIIYFRVDRLNLALWVWTFLAAVLIGAEQSHITEMVGRGFDTVMMYFLGRISIRGPQDLRDFYKGLAIAAVVMGVVGLIETTTSRSPYSSMVSSMTWDWYDKDDEYRLGFLRARGSTAVHIYFGMAMLTILGMLWALREYAARSITKLVSILSAFLAILSSMSSGPWIGCIQLILLNWFSGRTYLIRWALYLILFAAIFLEAASNRHFYNLIDYLALDPETAWYRTRLLEVAVAQWRDYWLVGVGSNTPNHWAALVDGRDHIDIVNHFVLLALYGGIPALALYIATHVIAIRMIIRARREASNEGWRRLLFNLGALLIAIDISSMSVSLFGPVLLLSNILLGVIVSVTGPTFSGFLLDADSSGRQGTSSFSTT